MNFFFDSNVSLNDKFLEIIFILMGFLCIFLSLQQLRKGREGREINIEGFIFWGLLGVILSFGRWIPDIWSGILILLMIIPAITGRRKGTSVFTSEESRNVIISQGFKIFLPALSIGFVSIFFSVFTKINALVSIGIGVFVSMLILRLFSRKNNMYSFVKNATSMLERVGHLSILPMLLASLGVIYNKAGVGSVISELFKNLIPQGNIYVGAIFLGIGMVFFTILMGNSFAAITVMLVGIAQPFVLSYQIDPVIGMILLSIGSCGTLLTPMAANFNMVPISLLEMKDKHGVIKNQIFVSLIMFFFQMFYFIFVFIVLN